MLNEIRLIGNVGKDPEFKQVGDSKVASFSLATSETYKDKSGVKQTQTEWHNIQAWGKLAEIIAQYVKKGDRLFIGGSVHYRTWEKDGQKYYATEVKADTMKMLSGKSDEKGGSSKPDYSVNDQLEFDDLPF